jgi:hypothetical protein
MLAMLSAALYFNVSNDALFFKAAAIDVMITIPVLYLAVTWQRSIPKITVIPLTLVGLSIVGYFIPSNELPWFTSLKSVWIGLAEMVVLTFVITRFIAIRRAYRDQVGTAESRQLRSAVAEVIPGVAGKIFVGEILTLYYALFAWWRKNIRQHTCFTSYRENQVFVIYAVILFLLTAETLILHILLDHWSSTVAWIISGISIYSFLQIAGIMSSIWRIPTRISGGMLDLNYGIAASSLIRLDNIADVRPYGEMNDTNPSAIRMTMLGSLEPVNLTLFLHEPVAVDRLYGKTLYTSEIHMFVDDADRFTRMIHPSA